MKIKLELPDLALALGSVSLILVGLVVLATPGYRYLQNRAQESAILGNAATVQLAAETYAASHGGRFPEDALDLLPYLPEDRSPTNPVSGKPLAFRGGPGDLTYRSPTRGSDYIIEAWGGADDGKRHLLLSLSGRKPRSDH